MILGCVFLGVKVIEYADKFEHHHVPGANYDWLYHEQHAAAGRRARRRRRPREAHRAV